MARFTLPRDVYFGEGALENLKTLRGTRAMIVVGGGSMRRFGFLERAENYLREAGMEVRLIEGVEPDPSVETVLRGAETMRAFEPDWIVAIGGGSPIDAAKAMWAFYEYPDVTFEQLCVPFGFPELRQKAHFAAIPTTSGTATEVTAFSVITDYEKGIKYPLASWGSIINAATNLYVMTNYWFIWIPAGFLILLTVLGFNFVGDGLRDAFDPKMKR